MKFGMIGRKVGMTQIFAEDGKHHPATVIEAGPCFVIQKKTTDKDGYNAVQLGYDPKVIQLRTKAQEKSGQKKSGTRRKNTVTRPMVGHFEKAGQGAFRVLKEFRLDSIDGYEVGQQVTIDGGIDVGDKIAVIGASKGKGMQGVVKLYHHRGGSITHGSRFHRIPGSIGNHTSPGRVFKNKRLPRHMGADRVTVLNLVVLRVDKENNLLYVHGAIPGPANGVVLIKKAK
ncbi:MAG: 50S ribosomal protein L3 [Myxococcales bacterium]|nr:MAG: 50S ribosomal protein L3 [Myxococcales bacterium]